MTSRELFNNIMHYGPFDRMPVWHWAGWQETNARWAGEGLGPGVDPWQYLDAEPTVSHNAIPVNHGLFPGFPEEVLEDTESYRVFRQFDGVVAKHWKGRSSIPTYIDFTMTDRRGWPEYEKRLQPDPARIPFDIDAIIHERTSNGRAISVGTGSMIGWIRDWMGVENLAYLAADDPQLIGEMVETISDLVCWGLDQVLPKVKVDIGWAWEDICYRSGPLVSPGVFQKYVVPGYQKVSAKLRQHGCELHAVDCDGKIDALAPLWLEGGVNVMFPIEIGVWDADPAACRKRYGRDMRIIGGINKLALERGRAAIDEEIERRRPLMSEGGFIPLPDHLITPGVPLDDYRYYLDRIRDLRF